MKKSIITSGSSLIPNTFTDGRSKAVYFVAIPLRFVCSDLLRVLFCDVVSSHSNLIAVF